MKLLVRPELPTAAAGTSQAPSAALDNSALFKPTPPHLSIGSDCSDKLSHFYPSPAMAISSEERAVFISMGERIAALRKAHNVTQVQLAEAIGVSQQTLPSYEVGRQRIPVSALPVVAHTLAVSLEELFGQSKPASRGGKRGPPPQWQQQIEAVSLLPKSQQQFVARTIETVLAQAGAR